MGADRSLSVPGRTREEVRSLSEEVHSSDEVHSLGEKVQDTARAAAAAAGRG